MEIINELNVDEVSIYENGPFDLCRGPHVDKTNQIGAVAFKVSGAYWRGSEKNKCYNVFMEQHFPIKKN